MQWPSCGRPPEDEATRAISVLWIIFNHFGTAEEFSYFLDADTTNDALVNCVFGKLELFGSIFSRISSISAMLNPGGTTSYFIVFASGKLIHNRSCLS